MPSRAEGSIELLTLPENAPDKWPSCLAERLRRRLGRPWGKSIGNGVTTARHLLLLNNMEAIEVPTILTASGLGDVNA